MNLTIRTEHEKEFNQIYDFVRIAFETAQVSDGNEQNFVNELRASENYIPELALVALVDGNIVGHIMLTKYIVQDLNQNHDVLLLAPLSVDLNYRGQGIGSKLVMKSFELARKMGYTAVVLVGDPAFYQRFGFKSSVDFGINCHEIPAQYVQACELVEGSLDNVFGTLTF